MLFYNRRNSKNSGRSAVSRHKRESIGRSVALFALCACVLPPMLALSACNPSKPAVSGETPVPSHSPAPMQTAAPTDKPVPSAEPSASPSELPTLEPSELPTLEPSATPSEAPSPAPEPTESGDKSTLAKFLGILGYGSVKAEDVKAEGAKVYRFLIDKSEKLFAIENDADFSIQNMLFEGYEYELAIENDTVTAAQFVGSLEESAACPVSYSPGKRTLKNLLAAAMQPVGQTLYVYGGGWNWQDDGASILARRIGRPRTWRDFFLSQTAAYSYKDEASPETSYYPFGGWCEYFYAGLDCSGYLGHTLYNTLESKIGGAGYVFKSTDFAKTLSDMGLGSFSAGTLENGGTKLQSGDIVSFKGHTYLVLGRCEDESLVILHSSPTPSRAGNKGGGVQLSAIETAKGNMALELITRYTERYFPEWSARYENIAVPYSTYVGFERSGNAGFFRWSIGEGGALSDPDGILGMSAEQILRTLFGE